MQRLVILESPYAGNVLQRWLNVRYARRCLRHSLMLGEAPLASHLLYTQPGVLDDKKPEQRRMGIDAGHAWKDKAEAFVVYMDRGITPGMQLAIERATVAGIPVLYRSIKQ